MLHFFRKIRRDLLANSQFFKYLKYAIGEIILVVIGILIALQINNWYEKRKISEIELALLTNLKNDINLDILYFQLSDSGYAEKEAESEIAIKLFNKAKTIKDIDSVRSLINPTWNEIRINHHTYDEMVSLSIGYSMNNKELQKLIAEYYLIVEQYKIYINKVNSLQSHLWIESPEIQPGRMLFDQLENPQIDLKLIDTSWIANPNSPTYIAVYRFLRSNQEYNNVYRRRVYQFLLKELIHSKLRLMMNLKFEINNERLINNLLNHHSGFSFHHSLTFSCIHSLTSSS